MTDLLYSLLRTYLDAGYHDVQGFWHCTLSEITALLEAAVRRIQREQRRQENETKQQIIMLRNLSLQTGESVACLFDKRKRELTPLSAYYPGLFEDSSQREEMSLDAYTVLFEDFAYRHNARRKKQKGGVAADGE